MGVCESKEHICPSSLLLSEVNNYGHCQFERKRRKKRRNKDRYSNKRKKKQKGRKEGRRKMKGRELLSTKSMSC